MINKSGFLTKEGGRIRSWKRRWFVLESGCIRYYKDKTDRKVLGEIQLEGPCAVISPAATGGGNIQQKQCTLQVQTPSRTYRMYADSVAEKDEWVKVIQSVLDTFKGVNHTSHVDNRPRVTQSDFDLIKMIGKGNFGKVLLVRYKANNNLFAMKVLSKNYIVQKNEVEHTMSECQILQQIEHPFLVKLHFSFQTPENLFLILDFVNGGELFFHLQREKKFSEERVKFYAAEILLGLEHLHNSSIIYRDIKLENLLLSRDGHIVITDFGLSKKGNRGEQTRTATFCGTPEYMAPEMLAQPGALYGKEVDWWSYGSLLYEMLTGLPPFFHDDVQEMYRRILMDKLTFPSFISPIAQDYIARLLAKNPADRLSDPNLMKRHKWFEGLSWENLFMKKVTPPFIPPVRGPEDTSLIDPVFTSEAATIQPDEEHEVDPSFNDGQQGQSQSSSATTAAGPDLDAQLKFAGFTYVKE